jgi:methylated-DNA-[protein]-cysteine S-methyltransferase
MEKIKFDILSTKWGFVALASGKRGLRHLILPQVKKQQAFDILCRQLHGEELVPDDSLPVFRELGAKLKQYFSGRPVEFIYKLDYNVATVFQREVWSVVRTIPPGQTRTYGWVAERLGDPDSKRAVGQALNANPLPLVVPCHRVVAAHGRLGGFGGGVEMKTKLLKLEGAILA